MSNTILPGRAHTGDSISDDSPFAATAIIEVARRYAAAGLSVIPVRADGSKAAACKWGEFEERSPTTEELSGWFGPDRPVGLAIVCGKVSGNLAVLDFESAAAWDKWRARLAEVGGDAWVAGCPEVRTPKGGRHLYCRIEEGWVAGGKLAQAGTKETVIEVRGQGHYVLAPGCPPACHPLNLPYAGVRDGWLAADAVPGPVSIETFGVLCDLAREQNEYVPPERTRTAAPAPSDAKGDRPGDDFNRRASWSEVLEPHGWKVDRTAGEVTYWTRPGKSVGVSATTGRCRSDQGGDLLYVFSSNAAPFEPQTAYDKFGAKAQLDHAGDLSAAAKDLRAAGYGKTDVTPGIIFGAPTGQVGNALDDGITPNFDFATNEDLEKFDIGLKWVWDKWLQVGSVNLLAAEGGSGKTRFVADLCRRVHLGLPFPDDAPTQQWASEYLAMWVAGDRNHGELVTLSKSFGFGDRICYSGSKNDPLGGVTLQAAGDFKALAERVKAARPLFLVIDTAGGATSLNMSKQEEARQLFAPLSDMAMRLGVCVIVITHLNATKNVLGKRAEERVRTVIRITSADREPATQRRIEVVKSNAIYPLPVGMWLGEDGNTYSLTDVPTKPEDLANGTAAGAGSQIMRSAGKTAKCVEFLERILAAGPLKRTDVTIKATKEGFDPKTLKKAFDSLWDQKRMLKVTVNAALWWYLAQQPIVYYSLTDGDEADTPENDPADAA